MDKKREFHQRVLDHFGLVEATRVDDSQEHQRRELSKALNEWPGRPASTLDVAYTFSDRVIVYHWPEVVMDSVPYEKMTWEIPYTVVDGKYEFGQPVAVEMAVIFEPVTESSNSQPKKRLVEEVAPGLQLVESVPGDGNRKVKAIGITADVVNANGRLYPWKVLAEAVKGLNSHLHESSGQARLIATGEAEHPSDKGGRSNILETVVAWNSASLDSSGRVILEGQVLNTTKGRDVQVLLESGVRIGVSMRGKGSTRTITRGGQKIDEVTQLTIGAFDLVANPSDPNGAIIEAEQDVVTDIKPVVQEVKETITMDPTKEELEALKAQLAQKEKQLTEATAAQEELQKMKVAEAINRTIEEGTKALSYPGDMNKLFVESIRAAEPTTPEAAKALIENKRREYDALASTKSLQAMGKDVEVVGPVFESRTGQPAFTQAAYEINESLITHGEGRRLSAELQETPGGILARRMLARFDQLYANQMARESKEFNEAMTTGDMNLPYSVARMLIEQAYPGLVAASIYDFGPTDVSPARVYFETYAGDTGASATITDEAVTASLTSWVSLAHKRVRPGTVVVTHTSGSPTYAEGTDYVVDYEVGKILALATITEGQSVKVDYTYDAYREGEGTAIERAENNLSFATLEIAADRLAMEVTTEAILFSRSQLGYDAVNRTLGNLVRLVRRKIDKDILYKGLAAALRQANNSGGTWTSASDDPSILVKYIGVAKTKVSNRFYQPTSIVMSDTNSDRMSNWDGFKVMGFDNARLNSAGFVGSVKGLPVYSSPEYPDNYIQVVNRELVMHRVYEPMRFKGPYPSIVNGKLIASEQFYIEEFNGSLVPVVEKTAYVKVV